MRQWVDDFYKARLKEGMTIKEIDEMDIAYYLKLARMKDNAERKIIEEKEKTIYIDELDFL
jgi:hypothetical protein